MASRAEGVALGGGELRACRGMRTCTVGFKAHDL